MVAACARPRSASACTWSRSNGPPAAPSRLDASRRSDGDQLQRRNPFLSTAAVPRRRHIPRLAAAAEASPPLQQVQQEVGTRNVVVAVDASEDSLVAFLWTLNNLWKKGDSLYLLHVVPDVFQTPASGSIYYMPPATDPEVERKLWQQAKEFLQDNFVEHAQARGVEVQVVLIKESKYHHIGKAVCRKAEELNAAPLVLAAHQKSLLESWVLGSVSQFCASNCKRPVLLLHPDHSTL